MKDRLETAQLIIWVLVALAAFYGLYQAISLAWVGDDAFISYRYAEHLIEGHGLVYNPGEQVEGYTNYLWTILVALGMLAGIDPIVFSHILSITAYMLTAAILVYLSFKLSKREETGGRSLVFPAAAMAILVQHDYHIYATSGLETSPASMLVTLGFALLVLKDSRRWFLLAGYVLIMGAMTRPDAMIFYIMGIPYILMLGGDKRKLLLPYVLPLIIIYLPYWLWRYSYYGYPFPNTYYAKSAYLTYFSQGLTYLMLYVRTYYILILLPIAMILTIPEILKRYIAQKKLETTLNRVWVLGILFIIPYVFYVVRSGGDFMFARFFIPITPGCFLLLESGILYLSRKPQLRLAVGAVLILAVFFRWNQFDQPQEMIDGIADERSYYPSEYVEQAKRDGRNMQKYLSGMDVTIGFYGSKAMTAYYSKLPDVVELHTGLTDEYIAHLPLKERGRPGHEKMAPRDYMFRRGINFVLKPTSLPIEDSTKALFLDSTILHIFIYENEIMNELKKKPGVVFLDLPRFLDEYIKNFEQTPPEQIIRDFNFLKTYYFDHNNDPGRLQPFLNKLREIQR
ncbi:MAG: hypothetical protein GF310_12135 [candidate division Zixibacteria bacterium]|nr:hypothetical protein [candidate division Zixibacteria bacterium]